MRSDFNNLELMIPVLSMQAVFGLGCFGCVFFFGSWFVWFVFSFSW